MKKMVDELVYEVRSNTSKKRISSTSLRTNVKQSASQKQEQHQKNKLQEKPVQNVKKETFKRFFCLWLF